MKLWNGSRGKCLWGREGRRQCTVIKAKIASINMHMFGCKNVQYSSKWTLIILWHCIYTRFANQLGICPEFIALHKKPPESYRNVVYCMEKHVLIFKRALSTTYYPKHELIETKVLWRTSLDPEVHEPMLTSQKVLIQHPSTWCKKLLDRTPIIHSHLAPL